jgi:hypothetical protein
MFIIATKDPQFEFAFFADLFADLGAFSLHGAIAPCKPAQANASASASSQGFAEDGVRWERRQL